MKNALKVLESELVRIENQRIDCIGDNGFEKPACAGRIKELSSKYYEIEGTIEYLKARIALEKAVNNAV